MHVGHCSIPCPGPQQGPSTSWSLSTLAFPCGRPGSFSKERKCCTKQNVRLTLVEAECQGEEQEDTSYLHGQGDVLLSAAERNRDTPQCLRDPASGSLLGHLYLSHSWHHTTQPAPPHSPVVTTFKVRGQQQVATGSLVGARMKASPKPMEVTILISSEDWGPVPGVGDSSGCALQALIEQLCTRKQDWRNGQDSKGNTVSSRVALINDPAAATCRVQLSGEATSG